MKRMLSLLLTLFAAVAIGGCSASAPSPASAAQKQAAPLTVVPPYADPEYVLQVTPPSPGKWAERRNVTDKDRPQAVLRLTHDTDGATLDFSFAPAQDWTLPYLLADISQKETVRGLRLVSTHTYAPGRTELVGGREGGKGARIVLLQAPSMPHSILIVALESPQATYAANSAALDALLASMVISVTGPLSPQAAVAQCLSEKGAAVYSAEWCGPCKMQMERFGDAANRVRHYACSDKQGDTRPMCEDAKIEVYPTWIFADGSRLEGDYSLETLAEHAGCPPPSYPQ